MESHPAIKKEQTIVTCNNMGESQIHYAKIKKLDSNQTGIKMQTY